MACNTRWPNSDKYLDDKAEHDTRSAEEVLDLCESSYNLGLNIQDRPTDMIAVNTQEHARVGAQPRPTTEKPLNLKNGPGIEDSEVLHHLHEPESLTDRQGRDSDPSTAPSEQVKGRAGTTAKNEIAAAGMPHEEGLLKLMPGLVMKQLGEVPEVNKQETTTFHFPSLIKVKEVMFEDNSISEGTVYKPKDRVDRVASVTSRLNYEHQQQLLETFFNYQAKDLTAKPDEPDLTESIEATAKLDEPDLTAIEDAVAEIQQEPSKVVQLSSIQQVDPIRNLKEILLNHREGKYEPILMDKVNSIFIPGQNQSQIFANPDPENMQGVMPMLLYLDVSALNDIRIQSRADTLDDLQRALVEGKFIPTLKPIGSPEVRAAAIVAALSASVMLEMVQLGIEVQAALEATAKLTLTVADTVANHRKLGALATTHGYDHNECAHYRQIINNQASEVGSLWANLDAVHLQCERMQAL